MFALLLVALVTNGHAANFAPKTKWQKFCERHLVAEIYYPDELLHLPTPTLIRQFREIGGRLYWEKSADRSYSLLARLKAFKEALELRYSDATAQEKDAIDEAFEDYPIGA